MKVNFQALGCRLNEAELESWTQQFAAKGYQSTADRAEADLIVFNSCSVTAEADRKSRKLINRIRRENPDSRLIVTGCYASLKPEVVQTQLGVDLVISNPHKDQLVDRALQHFELPEQSSLDDNQALFTRGRHRAFIKVQDGCRYRCTFCIVTLARGDERSRSPQDIIGEINRLHRSGVQEVVITGVHVGGYGSDIGSNLYELLGRLLERTEIPRIRLASVEPWDLPEQFFELFNNPRLMPHIHLPLQSGADSVLRRMARRCKTAEFSAIVEKARAIDPLFNITTDIIVGFPGETEDEWRQTMDYVESIGFGHIHIFSYSRREGTKAAGLPGQVSDAVKKQRHQSIHQLASASKQEALLHHVGKTAKVLLEQENDGLWSAYTPHYHRVHLRAEGAQPMDIVDVRIDRLAANGAGLMADIQA